MKRSVTKIVGSIFFVGFCFLQMAAGSSDPETSPVPARSASISVDQIQALVDAGRYEEAVGKGRKYLKNDKNPTVYTLVGFSLRKQKKWDESVKAYKSALAIDPNHNQAKEYLGVAYLHLKQGKKARQLYDELSASDPNLAAMLKNEAAKQGVKW